jgi:glutaredoxin-like protein
MSDSPAVTFYWRPGCYFCINLERQLSQEGLELTKRNIWEDPASAAFVRSVANGNETVPTVVVGSTSMVNPSPAQVLAALRQEAGQVQPE